MEKLLNEGEFPSNPLVVTDINSKFKDLEVKKIIEITPDKLIDEARLQF